jgi:uncharacterized membrane protein YkvA (DUF1232 family)
MKPFDKLLDEDIAGYEGRHDDIIYQAPALYRLLCALLDDPLLPRRLRPLVLAAIAYFVLPADVIPDDIYGPEGYLDDIWLACHVADIVRKEVASDRILEENWDGELAIETLLTDVLQSEQLDLSAETRSKILSYVTAGG